MKLSVNEIFGPTIQGEGKSAGLPVIFIRLAYCNLHCIWCDTPYTWNWEGTKFPHVSETRYSKEKEIHEMTIDEIVTQIRPMRANAVVISGGEPLIQQGKLIPLIQRLKHFNYWVEVETNGTIAPSDVFLNLVDQINCSPKLENSNNSRHHREKESALTELSKSKKTTFKFVVSSSRDTEEILNLVSKYKMEQVYLMPLGMTVKELNQTRNETINLCNKYGFIFSDRLHITKLGGGRGV